MDREELEERTKLFALSIIRLAKSLTAGRVADVIGWQLLKSGTAVGAIYREATRAESKADFVHKIGMVLKEASETVYWLELIRESSLAKDEEVNPALSEAKELLAIFSASHKTARKK